jgi:hypothetical protein
MSLEARLRRLEQKLRRDKEEPPLLLVFTDLDGRWTTGNGEEIDPATVDPRALVVIFSERPDGPQ